MSQYLKVAILMPFILNMDEDEERQQKDEQRAGKILTCINVSFVFFATACVAANEGWHLFDS